MAGIIEKMSASTDLIGIEVAATSASDKGFEACLATEAALAEGASEAPALPVTGASENRQAPTDTRPKLSKSLTQTPTQERAESSVATSDAALLIKSLGAMIEPEAKPVPVGLEALAKVIALRTGKPAVPSGAQPTTESLVGDAGKALAATTTESVDTMLSATGNAVAGNVSAPSMKTVSKPMVDVAQSLMQTESETGDSQMSGAGKAALASNMTTQSSVSKDKVAVSNADRSSVLTDVTPGSERFASSDQASGRVEGSETTPALKGLSEGSSPSVMTRPESTSKVAGGDSNVSSVSQSGIVSGDEIDMALKSLKEVPSNQSVGVATQSSPLVSTQATTSVSAQTTTSVSAQTTTQNPSSSVLTVEATVAASSVARANVVTKNPQPVAEAGRVDANQPASQGSVNPTESVASIPVAANSTTEASRELSASTQPKHQEALQGEVKTSRVPTNPLPSSSTMRAEGRTQASGSAQGVVPQVTGMNAHIGNAGSASAFEEVKAQDSRIITPNPARSGSNESQSSKEVGATLKGTMMQNETLRSRIDAAPKNSSVSATEAREVLTQASKLVRPSSSSMRAEPRRPMSRPTLSASDRIKVLGKALRSEVVDMEVGRGPRELAVAKSAMRPRLRSQASPIGDIASRLGTRAPVQAVASPTEVESPAVPQLSSQAVAAKTLANAQSDSNTFKLRFTDASTSNPHSPAAMGQDASAVTEVSRKVQVNGAVKEMKGTTFSMAAEVSRMATDGEPETRSSLNQDGQQGSKDGRQQGQSQGSAQTASTTQRVADQPSMSENAFADTVESAATAMEESDEVLMRGRSETRASSQVLKGSERSFAGKSAQNATQAQTQATMRQDLLHRLSAAEFPGHVSNLVFQNQEKARLQLHPAELGRMNLEMQVKAGEVQLKVAVESAAAASEIQSQLGQLKEQLQSQGLRLGDVSVDVSQKEFEADGQSMKDSGERGQGSERDQDSQRAEEEQTAINKNKKRKKSADGRLDVIA
jgi:flagellar hook-length control protein FliK